MVTYEILRNLRTAFRRGSGLKARVLHPLDEVRDLRRGIQTGGYCPSAGADYVHYVPTPYAVSSAILRFLELGPDDVFADVGCGKGRVVCLAAQARIRRAVGIEVDPSLCEDAQRNAERLRGRRAPIQIVNIPAQQYTYSDTTVIFMYRPFMANTMEVVMDRLERSLEAHPRSLRIGYVLPLEAHVLATRGWLRMYEEWPLARCPALRHPRAEIAASFWRTYPR
jgi:SAM-dependent methyltransferase